MHSFGSVNWDQVMTEHRRRLTWLASKIVGWADAEDVVQRTFLEVVQMGCVRADTLGGLLSRICRRRAMDLAKLRSRHPAVCVSQLDNGGEPWQPAVQATPLRALEERAAEREHKRQVAVLRREVQRYMDQLAQRGRVQDAQIVKLTCCDCLPVKAVAEAVGVQPHRVHDVKCSAMIAIRRQLDGDPSAVKLARDYRRKKQTTEEMERSDRMARAAMSWDELLDEVPAELC